MSILLSIYHKSANKASGKQSTNFFSFFVFTSVRTWAAQKFAIYISMVLRPLLRKHSSDKNSALKQRTPKNTFPYPSYSISILWFTHLAMKNSSSCRWPSSTTFVFLPSDKLCNKNAKYLQTSDKLSNPNLTHLLMH